MKKFSIPAFGLLLSALTSPVFAAEPFSGPFVGVQAGYERTELGTVSGTLGNLPVGRLNDTVTGGIFAGFDHKLSPRVVLGAEAGINLTDSDDLGTTIGGNRIGIDPERSMDLSARLGYLVDDRTLLYARGGYTNVRAETTISTAAAVRSDSSNLDGWLVGGGIERSLSDSISTRLEYRYSDLSAHDGKFDRHQVLLGVAYRF